MFRGTVAIVGPGGVGKSPLDDLFMADVTRLDPYRMRPSGPRGPGDRLYASPELRGKIRQMLYDLGYHGETIPCVHGKIEWFSEANVLLFELRDDYWQLLFLSGPSGSLAKADIYAPILYSLLASPGIRPLFGKIHILMLNPSPESVVISEDLNGVKKATRENCILRGDTNESVCAREQSVEQEAPAWKELLGTCDAFEYLSWSFPEYRFKDSNRVELLREARECLLELKPDLEEFLKPEAGIT